MQPQNIHPANQYNRKKIIWGIACLAGPVALIILSLLLYAVANFISGSTTQNSDELLSEPSPVTTIVNILLFIVGAFSVVAIVPGLIIGIILLATAKK